MNTNSEVRNGRNGSPSGPMTSITMLLRISSTRDSTAFWIPRGTSVGLRNAMMKIAPMMTADISIQNETW